MFRLLLPVLLLCGGAAVAALPPSVPAAGKPACRQRRGPRLRLCLYVL